MTTIGTTRRFSADFEADGTDTDTTVVVKVMDPDGAWTSPDEVDDAGQGQYHVDVALTKAGPWVVRFEGSGTVPASVETTVVVSRSPF